MIGTKTSIHWHKTEYQRINITDFFIVYLVEKDIQLKSSPQAQIQKLETNQTRRKLKSQTCNTTEHITATPC